MHCYLGYTFGPWCISPSLIGSIQRTVLQSLLTGFLAIKGCKDNLCFLSDMVYWVTTGSNGEGRKTNTKKSLGLWNMLRSRPPSYSKRSLGLCFLFTSRQVDIGMQLFCTLGFLLLCYTNP